MGRGIPPMTLALAAFFVIAHIAFQFASIDAKNFIYYTFAVIPLRFDANGPDSFTHWYEALGPLFGHAFLHGGWAHLLMNTIVFVQGAPVVEWRIGPWRLLALFFISAAAGAGAYVLFNPHGTIPAVGASGAACGVFAACFMALGRNWRDAWRRPEIRNLAIVFLVVNVGLAAAARATGLLPIAWEAHLGGFIGGALAYLALAPKQAVAPGPWG